MKKRHGNRHLFNVLGNTKPTLRNAILKYGVDKGYISLISKLFLNLTEGNVQIPEVAKQDTKHKLATERFHRRNVLSPMERFEDNLSKFINDENIADD